MATTALEHARDSAGVSGANIYPFAVGGLEMELNQAAAVLDLGCGVGNFGAFWRGKFPGRIDGTDGVRFPEFRSASYAAFHEANLNEPLAGLAPGTYDAVFSLEVIHYLDNPRAFVRGAAALLRPGGNLKRTPTFSSTTSSA